MSRATAVAPAETIQVTVKDPAGIVHGDRILAPGSVQQVSREVGARWVGEGRAIGRSTYRYVALGGIAIHGRVLSRGEVVEVAEAAPGPVLESKRVLELKPGQAVPDPLPADPLDARYWWKGPRVRVKATAPGRLADGVRADAAGQVLELYEADAVENAASGKVEVLGRLTELGSKVLASLRRGTPVCYEDEARKQRAKDDVADARPPGVLVAAADAGTFAGKFRRAGAEFRIPEDEALSHILAGQLQLREMPRESLQRSLNAARRL